MPIKSTRLAPRLVLGALAAALALTLAACSSSGGTSTTTPPPSSTASAPATTPPASSPATAGALTGTWNGQYSGAYTGTFKLKWTQTGSHLHGKIHISNPAAELGINGTVNGTSIRFGTVGSYGITYTGTVNGTSMSGTYQVKGSGGGPWSASKA